MTATEPPTTAASPAGIALVTGASRGIGRAIAARLISDGFQVAGVHRSGDVPNGVVSIEADITDPDAAETIFSRAEAELGPVTTLVCNAGITRDTLLARMSDEQWDDVVATNLTATFRLVRRASRAMMRARAGRIVLLSSVVALLGSPGQVNYAASKAGLVGLGRSVARELGPRGVTCNIVAPGFIETDMTAALSEETVAGYRTRIPLQRLGSADEVAATVAFLASPAAAYITGAVIPVDGGLGMGH
ncbi:MAG: 3-oxoacyl-ACP reductase FabG [Propionibacteriaceae bacterium]|jgi:3-oxoacyl-[acyl-carrier protein] reductase|nr:3-oxoacyl-ACP reductase FabG [Propionibacteriaceae bacterium]